MNDKKKNIPLIVSLSIPVLMILLVTISIYVPVLFVKPQFDFIYSTGGGYYYNNKYSVVHEKIIKNPIKHDDNNKYYQNKPEPRLFYYNVQSFTAREIPFDEVRKYRLDNRLMSPDGFEIVSGNRSFDIFFFSGSSYYDKFLKKGAFSRNIKIGRSYYYNFKFLGWIKE